MGDTVLHTCSAEDLVVHKAFAGRSQDWIDIEMVVARQGDLLATDLVLDEALPLLDVKQAIDDRYHLQAILGM